MSYPLQAMLKIRETREDRAASELTRARRERDAAERELNVRREARSSYEATKENRRDRVYSAIIGRTVHREAIEEAREAVTRIDEEGLLLEEDEIKATRVLETRVREMRAARIRHVAAEKAKEKIVLHREAWIDADRLEQERAEDLELEEFSGMKAVECD